MPKKKGAYGGGYSGPRKGGNVRGGKGNKTPKGNPRHKKKKK